MSTISIVAAISDNNAIGKNLGLLPFISVRNKAAAR